MGRKLYDQEFKKTLVDLLKSGKTSRELSTEYGVSLASINRWGQEFGSRSEDSSILKTEQMKIKALEKELKEIKLERDILKKAVSIFSKNDR